MFGRPVSVNDGWAVVGVPRDGDSGYRSGAAYVFRHNDNGTPFDLTDDFWTEEAKLSASDANTEAWFGSSVCISGDRMFIGASGTPLGYGRGAAYVFRLDENGTPTDPDDDQWVEEAKLTASDGAIEDYFGTAVSIDGDWAVVGASRADHLAWEDTGVAYVFWRDDLGTPSDPSDDIWVEHSSLHPSDAGPRDRFGGSVAISGGHLVAGAQMWWDYGAGIRCGSAYVFRREDLGTPSDPSDDAWVQEWKLVTPNAATEDRFGRHVALDGDLALVGANVSDAAGPNSGAAYLFHRYDHGTPLDPTDDVWFHEAQLIGADTAAGDSLGSVSISGNRAVVGAYLDDPACPNNPECDSGSAYVFEGHDNGTPSWPYDDYWTQLAKLVPSDGSKDDEFGLSVSISGDWIIGGAFRDDDACLVPEDPHNNCESGSAYVFALGDVDADEVIDGCDPCPYDNPDDTDGDSVCDSDDACPGLDDTLDSDGDFVPDCLDGCPDDHNKTSPGVCGCGVADIDTDLDTVLDCFDQCPGQDDRIDANGNGLPDCEEPGPVPTVSGWGVTAMGLVLLAVARLHFRRRLLTNV